MPADNYDASALALPIDEPPPPRPSSSWPRTSSSFRRRSSSFSAHPPSFQTRVMKQAGKLKRRGLRTYNRLTPAQRIAVVIGGLICLVLSILFLVYNERIFHSLLPYAKKWRDIPAGWLILWFLIIIVSFPPLIGYSSLLTIAGFVYGFPNGYVVHT